MTDKGLISDESAYPWDLPELNKVSRFLTSLKDSKIETTQCTACGNIQWPPRIVCTKCLSMNLKWVELPKSGTMVGLSLAYVGLAKGENSPMIVAAVHLDGEQELRLLTRIVGAKYEDLKIGMRVRFAESALVDGKPYWAFTPA